MRPRRRSGLLADVAALPGRALRAVRAQGLRATARAALEVHLLERARRARVRLELAWWRARRAGDHGRVLDPPALPARPPVTPHGEQVDVVVCVHDALPAVRRCLAALARHARPGERLILVDDGSGPETAAALQAFAAEHGATLLREEVARGYTRAANRGIAAGQAPWVVLLNSDAEVTAGWLDRLLACARSDPRIGLVGPLSNAASFQSVPRLREGGDWATNPLPPGRTADELASLLARHAARMHPRVPVLNGFCLLVRRGVLDAVGPLDADRFPQGYGEENDLALRAAAAGLELAVADDAYVAHAHSASFGDARRRALAAAGDAALRARHGGATLRAVARRLEDDPVLAGLRAHAGALWERERLRDLIRARHGGRRLLVLLQAAGASGGVNVLLSEGRALQAGGVDVTLVQDERLAAGFHAAYPDPGLPLVLAAPGALPALARGADAVLASFHPTVGWLAALPPAGSGGPVRGYYVQDYEPLFHPEGSPARAVALASYAAPGLALLTKTEWTARQLRERHGVSAAVVGPSVELDLFRPRPREAPPTPLRVAALVRPSTPRRAARETLALLRRARRRFGPALEPVLFGCAPHDPGFLALPRDFGWSCYGELRPEQVAALLPSCDLFVDVSRHQAMGLTALEAMACGLAVIVPRRGGAGAFARDGENALVVDSDDGEACSAALARLVEDAGLRRRLGEQALADACAFPPERAALALADALWGG